MNAFFQNVIKYGKDRMFDEVNNSTYLDLMFKGLQRILVISRNGYGEMDSIACIKLINTILENLTGALDQALPSIIDVLHRELTAEDNQSKKGLIKVIHISLMHCFLYNCKLTLEILDTKHWKDLFIGTFIKTYPKYKFEFEHRKVIFGLTAVLTQCPEDVQEHVETFMVFVVKSVRAYIIDRQKQVEQEFEIEQ